MNDLATIWPTMTNAQKQNTAVTLAGRYQLSRFLALMNNYEMGLNATATAQNSYNSAVKENEKYMQSITAKINLVKSSWQQLTMTVGNAGLSEAIVLALTAVNNLLQGFNKLVDVMGKWTMAFPLVAAGIAAFVTQFQRAKAEALAFQMAMLGMNTNMSRMAFTMSAQVTTSGLLATAFGTLRTAAIGLTTALLTNPLTWITVALTAIPMVIGHFQRLKAEQEALAMKAEDNNKAFKDFKAELAAGTVNQTSLDVFNAKADVADKLLDKLKKKSDDYTKSQGNLAAAQGNLSSQYGIANAQMGQYNNWQDKLTKKNKEELADIGIKYEKYNSFQELMEAVTKKQVDYTTAVETGQGILQEAEKQLMFNADAFDAVGEEVEETMTLMQNFFGFNEQMIQEMVGSYNAIQVLTQVQNKNQAQTEALNQALDVFVAKTGLSRDELLKNPAAMLEVISYSQQMQEKWGEATDEVLSNEQAKQLAVDVTTSNVQQATADQTAAERVAAEEKALAAQQEAEKKAEAFGKVREEMLLTKALFGEWTEEDKKKAFERAGVIDSTSKENIGAFSSESLKAQDTQKAHETLASVTGNSSTKRQTAIDKAASTAFTKLGEEQTKLSETGTSWGNMSNSASNANSKVSSTTTSSAATTSSKLSTLIQKIKDAQLGWDDLRRVFSNPISGIINIAQKIFGSKEEEKKGKGGGTANIRPMGGMGGPITSGYGFRRDPFTGTKAFHHGVDTAGMLGESIRSRVSGQVVYSGYGASGTPLAGLGNVVAIKDGAGLTHIYGHNQNNYARVGQMVQAGQSIGSMGSTGRSTGTHSHYEVRMGGRSINPMGGTYKIQRGDTFSAIAKKYYGNAYNGGMNQLKALNPQIKDINRIYAGQTLTVPDAKSSTTTTTAPKTSTPTPAPAPVARESYDSAESRLRYREQTGVYTDPMQSINYRRDSMRASATTLSEQRQYTVDQINDMGKLDNMNALNQSFASAGLFLNPQELATVKANLTAMVQENVLGKLNDQTTAWLDTFNKGVKESNASITALLDAADDVRQRKSDEKHDNFVNNHVANTMSGLGIDPNAGMSQLELMEQKAQDIQELIQKRAEESAELEYRLSSNYITPRLAELDGYKQQIENQMAQVEATLRGQGITDDSVISQAQADLAARLQEIQAEYTELQNAVALGNQTLAENDAEMAALAEQYKLLQAEIDATAEKEQMLTQIRDKVSDLFNWSAGDLWKDKTDEYGNVVRDIEGTIRGVLDVQQAIQDITADIYENIDKTVEEMITSIITSELPNLGDLFNSDSDYSGISDGINDAIDAIKPTWDETLNYMSGSIMNMFSSQSITDTMGSWMDNLATATEGLQPLFENLMMKFPEVIGKIMSDLPNLVYTAMQNTTVGVFNTVVEVLNRLVATVNQIVPSELRVPLFDQMEYATPTYTQNNETTNDQTVYQTGNVERNVTYIINTGVALASESELREFAMLLKEMMDEEEGRGN
ncbi:hypothetical protein [Microcystis phage MaeS]|nr:hypothetical protein [Microcystis phage MaeS]